MAPTTQSALNNPAKRASPAGSASGDTTLIIACAVIGGVLLLMLSGFLLRLLYLRRLRKQAELHTRLVDENAGGKTASSEVSGLIPLLGINSWNSSGGDAKEDSQLDFVNRSQSTDTIRPYAHEDHTLPTNSTTLMSESFLPAKASSRGLHPLVIPEHSYRPSTGQQAAVDLAGTGPTTPVLTPALSSVSSGSSESIYSQMSMMAYTPDIAVLTASPAPHLLPLSAQPASEDLDNEGSVTRSDTQTIGAMLAERAKRHPNKRVRSSSDISHIERAGSIRSAEFERKPSGSYRHRLAMKSRMRGTMPMESLTEAPDSASRYSVVSESPSISWRPPASSHLTPSPTSNSDRRSAPRHV